MPTRKTTFFTPKSNTHSSGLRIPQKSLVIGVDEAGRGAWAGPVVAACVAWAGKSPFKKKSLNDSKKLTALHREKTYWEILDLAKRGKISCGVGIVENIVIDEVGIREANRLAMQMALREIKKAQSTKQKGGLRILIDWRDNYFFDISSLPKPEYIIRWDLLVPQIMAASILAKVTRDMIMCEQEKMYPGYGFTQHKGYGTAYHQKRLQLLGVCAIHRKSYEPIRIRIKKSQI